MLAHGRIIVGATRGKRVDLRSGKNKKFLAVMLKENGRRDRGFGRRGTVVTGFETNAIAQVLAAAPDRRVILGGVRPDSRQGQRLSLARYRR